MDIKKIYLIESFDPSFDYKDKFVITLTPEASYCLDKIGVEYTVLEDYYDESEFVRKEGVYYKDQLAWFDKFDKFLFEIFPEAKAKNLKLATSYYYYIKSMVDSVILRCIAVKTFITKVKPTSITYISTRWKEDSINTTEYPLLFRKCQSLFSRIMPIFCKKYGIDFKRIVLNKNLLQNKDSSYENFSTRVKNSIKRNKCIRNLWHRFNTFNIKPVNNNGHNNTKYTILFLEMNRVLRKIMNDAQSKGYKVFYKQGSNIIGQFPQWHKSISNISSNESIKLDHFKLKLNSNTEIIKWINSYCHIDVSEIVSPRLFYFIDKFCPNFISLVDKYVNFYDNNQVDFVLTFHRVDTDEFAAIAATRYSKKTKSIRLQHGDDAFAINFRDFCEYSPFDIYFTTNDEKREYIKRRMHLGNFNTKIFQYPEILNDALRFKRIRFVTRPKRVLAYVPITYNWDNTIWNGVCRPDTWYFKWHKELLEFFSSRKDFDFIWKALPTGHGLVDLVPHIINDQKYINIRYVTEPSFVEWIKKIDLALFDYPSTALYEAAVCRLPVLALFFSSFNIIRESALKLFGKSLQPFSSFKEGIGKIEDFLDSNPDEFVVSVPRSKTPMIETLEHLRVKELVE